MDAQELDRLVAEIGEEILARYAGQPAPPAGTNAGSEGLNIPDVVCPGCTQRCPQTCERKSKEILAAGAERLSASDKLTGIDAAIAASIDHTLLRPEATAADVRKLCQEARKYNFASVCVNPYWVALVAAELAGSPVKVCTVVGFPLGANTTAIKVAETEARDPRGRAGNRHGDQRRRAARRQLRCGARRYSRRGADCAQRGRHRQSDSGNRAAR